MRNSGLCSIPILIHLNDSSQRIQSTLQQLADHYVQFERIRYHNDLQKALNRPLTACVSKRYFFLMLRRTSRYALFSWIALQGAKLKFPETCLPLRSKSTAVNSQKKIVGFSIADNTEFESRLEFVANLIKRPVLTQSDSTLDRSIICPKKARNT